MYRQCSTAEGYYNIKTRLELYIKLEVILISNDERICGVRVNVQDF
jgi:hypothetical protein